MAHQVLRVCLALLVLKVRMELPENKVPLDQKEMTAQKEKVDLKVLKEMTAHQERQDHRV